MSIFYNLIDDNKLLPEKEEGNIEYKLRLDLKTSFSVKKLTSQLLWRLNEGRNKNYQFDFLKKTINNKVMAHYVLGVYDNGDIGNLSLDELKITKDIFLLVVEKAGACVLLEEIHQFNNKNDIISYINYLIITPKSKDFKIKELNVLVAGPENVGKTTLIANICYGLKDDGNGHLRNYILKHSHEKISGNTTAIKKEIIGVNKNLINYETSTNWEDIVKLSEKIINIFDTPGNIKYIKSVIYSLRTFNIDLLLIVYVEKDPYVDFLINIATILEIKFVLIKNKIDLGNVYEIGDINISLKTEENIDKVKEILINTEQKKYKYFIDNMFRITDVYTVPDRDKIVGGVQVIGTNKKNSVVKLIYNNYCEELININTVYKKNIDSVSIDEDENGSLSFNLLTNKNINIKLTKTMIIVPEEYQINYINKEIKCKVLNRVNISNNKYYIINGNNQFYGNITSYDSNCFVLKPETKIYLQDDILIMLLFNNNDFFDNYIVAQYLS